MNTRKNCSLILGVLALLIGALQALAQAASWIGESVINKKPPKEIQFEDMVNGKQVGFPFSGRFPYTVRDDRDGRVRLFDGHREGWADKADFVLTRNAPAYFHERVQANPQDSWAFYMRAHGWYQKGEYANAIKDFTECIRLSPTEAAAHNSRGITWLAMREYDKAINDYSEAVRLKPKDALAYSNRGNAWWRKKDYEQAMADYDEAIRLDPRYPDLYINRAIAWGDKKRYDMAIKDLDEAIRLDPKDARAIRNRGYAWAKRRDYGKAIKDYDEAIRLDPKDYLAWNRKAWLLATCPDARFRDGKTAVKAALSALELNNSWLGMDALAAAYAESGNFEVAAILLERALKDAVFVREYGKDGRERLELYRNKQAYREK
jgi:tetratricopeptide (TPR) repeat protein